MSSNALNILHSIANRLDLVVNLEKSNVVVFRNGGFLSNTEKWYFDTSQLTSVNMYKYLGVIFTSRLTFQPALSDLADRGRKGVTAILKLLWSIGEHSPQIFFKLFDSQIQPFNIWGRNLGIHC